MAAATNTHEIGDSTGLVSTGAWAQRSQRAGSPGLVPWVLTLVLAAAGGFGGYFLYQKYTMAKSSAADARAQAVSMRHRLADANSRAMKSSAALTRARSELAAERALLEQENKKLERRAGRAGELEKKLAEAIARQGRITRQGVTVKLEMVDKVLFASGEADLTRRGMSILDKVGATLQQFPEKQIWVRGHTDDLAISNQRFGSNWELSSQRALNVVHYLQDDVGLKPQRLAAVAFGQYRPVSRKRSLNRRIEIVLAPRTISVR